MNWLLLLFLMFSGFFSYAALEKNTLVYTPQGLVHIATLLPKDAVISQFSELPVVRNKKQYIDELFVLDFESESLYVSGDQLFYDLQFEKWISAQNISVNTLLRDINNKAVQCIRVSRSKTAVEMYDLSLTRPHTFFVGKTGLLTHNMVITALPVAVSTIATIGKIGALVAGAISVFLKYNGEYKKQKYAHVEDQVIAVNPGGPEDDDHKKHPYGKYEDASYHHPNSRGRKSQSPRDGQAALDNSFEVKGLFNKQRRIGISNGEFVILDSHGDRLFHGHVRKWSELRQVTKNILIENRLVKPNGKII